jgi:hypothetical protein
MYCIKEMQKKTKSHLVSYTEQFPAKYVENCLSYVFVAKNGVYRMKYSCSYVTKSSSPCFSLCFLILCQ